MKAFSVSALSCFLISTTVGSAKEVTEEKESIAPPQPAEKRALLITAESLADSWQPFVAWKAEQGIVVEVQTVAAIQKGQDGEDTQEKIRVYVQSTIAEGGLDWLILGGDSLPNGGGLVPDRDTVHRTAWGTEQDIPTDIYYLSATNWDADGDGIYGEFSDDRAAISYPDGSIGLGRIPVRTVEDVAAYTEKVIAYESDYPGENFADSFLYTCTVSNAYPKVRRSWDDFVSKVLPETKVERYFAHQTPWDESRPGDFPLDSANLVKLFNENRVGKMHLHGHGLLGGWVMEDNKSLFGYEQVRKLENKGAYPLLTTVSCFTGHYDAKKDPSIAEAMLRVPEAGAIAIVAPCREGKPHFTNPKRDFPLMVREGKLDGTTLTMTLFWQKGIAEELSTGRALMATKAELAKQAAESANFHMCLCELNLLGDPTVAVHVTSEQGEGE